MRPAAALFKLARANLEKYPDHHDRLNVKAVHALIERWLKALESRNFEFNPLDAKTAPSLALDAHE